ncbi:MAG: MoaD/ThiS family protein [Novosphingobium sp.]
MVRLVFLGRLADVAGAGEIVLEVDTPISLAAILARLASPLAAALSEKRVKCALNGALVPHKGLIVAPGDELAFLPPVSGG